MLRQAPLALRFVLLEEFLTGVFGHIGGGAMSTNALQRKGIWADPNLDREISAAVIVNGQLVTGLLPVEQHPFYNVAWTLRPSIVNAVGQPAFSLTISTSAPTAPRYLNLAQLHSPNAE